MSFTLGSEIRSMRRIHFSLRMISRLRPLLSAAGAVLLTVSLAADELQVRTLSIESGGMVYDETRNLLWLTVRTSSPLHANRVIGIDPESMEIERSFPVGSDPVVLAIADDDSVLHVGLRGASGYQSIDPARDYVSPIYPIGGDDFGSYYVIDIKPIPGEPYAVAVARGRSGVITPERGVAIYDNGVERPDSTATTVTASHITFGSDPAILFGFNSSTSGRDFYRMEVDAQGVRLVDSVRELMTGGLTELAFSDGWIVSRGGAVVDPYNLEKVAVMGPRSPGSSESGSALADRDLGSIFWFRGLELSVFDTDTFTFKRSTAVDGLQSHSLQMVRWGDDGLAVRTMNDQLVVMRGAFISPDGPRADLRTEILSGPYDALEGEEAVYRILVRNAGPDDAANVRLSHETIGILDVEDAEADRGTVEVSEDTVEVSVDLLPAGDTLTLTVRGTPPGANIYPLSATASSETFDPRPAGSVGKAALRIHAYESPHRIRGQRFLRVEHLVPAPDEPVVYASVNMEDPLYGNHVLALDPMSGEVIESYFAGANPGRLAISDDGRYLYVVIRDRTMVARIDLEEGEKDLIFGLGLTNSRFQREAWDMVVLPGQPDSLAVAMGWHTSGEGIAVFDQGLMRSVVSPGNRMASSFVSNETGDRLYGFRSSSDFHRFWVDADGVTHQDNTSNLLTDPSRLRYADGLVYQHEGIVIDPEGLSRVGTYGSPTSDRIDGVPLPGVNRVLFLGGSGTIEAFRLDDFIQTAQWEVPGDFIPRVPFFTSHPRTVRTPLALWGETGAAFADEERLFFVDTTVASVEPGYLDVILENPPVDMRRGMDWTYTVEVANLGETPMTEVTLRQPPVSDLVIDAVESSRGVTTLLSDTFTVEAGTLLPGESIELAVTIRPTRPWNYNPQFEVLSVEADEYGEQRIQLLPFTVGNPGSLGVELPAEAGKGDGVLERAGTVTIGEPEAFDVMVALSGSDDSRLLVPESVTIPAGETATAFDIEVIDNDLLDGTTLVTVSAQATGFSDASAEIAIQDNIEVAIVVAAPESLVRGDVANAEILIDRVTWSAAEVTLVTVEAGWLLAPQTVVIPAGTDRVSFPVQVADRQVPIDGVTVTLTASAPGWLDGAAEVLVHPSEPVSPFNPFPFTTSHFASTTPTLTWNDSEASEWVVNGRFGTGDFFGWHRTATGDGGWAINDGTFDPPGPVEPHPPLSEGFNAVSYQNGPGTNVLYQELHLPAGAERITLRWTDRIRNGATRYRADLQEFRVEFEAVNGSFSRQLFVTKPGFPLQTSWQTREVDLTEFQGEQVRLVFIQTDSEGFLNVSLDNVSIQAEFPEETPVAGEQYDVYLGTSPELGPEDFYATSDSAELGVEGLEYGTTYYWRVVVRRGPHTVEGPVWSFRSAGLEAWITAPAGPTDDEELAFEVVFSEPVQTPSIESFVIGNAAQASISGEGAEYTLSIFPEGYGNVTVFLPADAVRNGEEEGNAPSDVALVFYFGSPSFSRWRESYFSAGERHADPEGTGPYGDAGSTGMANFLRYALGMHDGAMDFDLLPRAVKHPAAEGGIEFVFHRLRDPVDVEYVLEVSDDLQYWSNADEITEIVSMDDKVSVQRITVRFNEDFNPSGHRFLRLRAIHVPTEEGP